MRLESFWPPWVDQDKLTSILELLPIKQVKSVFAKENNSFFITENKQLFICGRIYAFQTMSDSCTHRYFKMPTPIMHLNLDMDEIMVKIKKYRELNQPIDKPMERQAINF